MDDFAVAGPFDGDAAVGGELAGLGEAGIDFDGFAGGEGDGLLVESGKFSGGGNYG